MGQKDVDGIAKSLIWVYIVCPDLSVWKLRNITVPILFIVRKFNNLTSALYSYLLTEWLGSPKQLF